MAAQSRNRTPAFAVLHGSARSFGGAADNKLIWTFIEPPARNVIPLPRRARTSTLDHHKRGLELAEGGTRQDRPELLEQAKVEFEAVLAAVPVTDATIAFRRRATINLASVLARLGENAEAVDLLENIRDSLSGDSGWLLDEPRALYALGNVYMTQGRADEAIDTYQRALATGRDHSPCR